MKLLRIISFFGLIIIMLSSCTMQKRVYSSGYHIEWNKSKCTVNKQDFATKENAKQKEQNNIEKIQQSKNKTNPFVLIEKKRITKYQQKKNIFILHQRNTSIINTKTDTVLAKVNAKKKVELNNNEKKTTYNHVAVKGFIYGMLENLIVISLIIISIVTYPYWFLPTLVAAYFMFLPFLIFTILAIVYSAKAFKQLKNDKLKGKGLAIAGLALGLFPFAAFIIGLLIALIVKG